MSGYHNPLETHSPTKPIAEHWFNRDLDLDYQDEDVYNIKANHSRYTDEEIAKHRSEWAAIKAQNTEKEKPVPQSNTSSKPPSMFCWFERNRQITIFLIAAITAIIVAYILKPARYKPLGGNSSSVLDTETGLIYPRGTGSSPMKKW